MTWLRTLFAALFVSMARTEAQAAQAESVTRVKALVLRDPLAENDQVLEVAP